MEGGNSEVAKGLMSQATPPAWVPPMMHAQPEQTAQTVGGRVRHNPFLEQAEAVGGFGSAYGNPVVGEPVNAGVHTLAYGSETPASAFSDMSLGGWESQADSPHSATASFLSGRTTGRHDERGGGTTGGRPPFSARKNGTEGIPGARNLYQSKEKRAIRSVAEQLKTRQPVKHPTRIRHIVAPPMDPELGPRHPDDLCPLPPRENALLDRISAGKMRAGAGPADTSTATMTSAGLNVGEWIANRQQQRIDVEAMGLSAPWLECKTRCPAEEAARVRLLADEVSRAVSADGNRPADHQNRRSSYIPRPASHEQSFIQHTADGTSQRGLRRRSSTSSLNNTAIAEPSTGPTRSGRLPFSAALLHLRTFVKENRWRLHDLFSRCGVTDNYMMTPDETCKLLEPISGLAPISFSIQHSVAYERALHCEGSLLPITSPQLKKLVTSFGVDRYGMLDYRVILDDYISKNEISSLQRMDKARRRRLGDKPQPSVHQCIASSIVQHGNPYEWLQKVGQSERERQRRLDLLISRSRVDYLELARLEREDEAARREGEHEDVWHSVLAPRIINARGAINWPAKEPRAQPKKGATAGAGRASTGAAGVQTEDEAVDAASSAVTFKEQGLLENVKRYRNRKSRRDYEATEKRLVQEGIVLPGGMLGKAMLSPPESPAPL